MTSLQLINLPYSSWWLGISYAKQRQTVPFRDPILVIARQSKSNRCGEVILVAGR